MNTTCRTRTTGCWSTGAFWILSEVNMMKKNQKKGMMGITIPTINVAGLTGFGMPTTKKRTDGGIAAVMQQFGNQTAIGGFKMPEVKPVKKTTGMIRGRTRRRDGDYALTPEEIADAEQLTGDQMAKLNLNDPKQAAMMDVALHKREREIIEDRKKGMSDDERAAYEEEEKREAKREANRGKKRRSNLTRYAKGIQKVNSFRGTIREFVVPEDELSDTPKYLRNKKIINIYCNEKGIMNYEPKPGDLINDVTKGPIVTPSKEDVNNRYVTPLHASWYRDGNLQEGYSETINSASFDDEDEPAKTSTPKRKRKKAEAPAAKRGTAKKSISTVKPTARRSQ
jgi:hypothetical protein